MTTTKTDARTTLIEHIRAVDRKLLAERRDEMLITEALDQKKLQSVMQIVSRLRALDFSAVPTIDKQIDITVGQLNKLLAKGKASTRDRALDFMWKVVIAAKNRDMSVFETPIGAAVALATAIESGFGNLQQIIAANVKKSDVESASDKALADLTGNNAKNVAKMIAQAFTPKKGQVKFDTKQVANDIMQAKLGTLVKISQSVRDGDMSNLVDDVMGALTSQKKDVPVDGTKPGTKDAEKGAANQAPAAAAAGGEKSAVDAHKVAAEAGVEASVIAKVAMALDKLGYTLIKK